MKKILRFILRFFEDVDIASMIALALGAILLGSWIFIGITHWREIVKPPKDSGAFARQITRTVQEADDFLREYEKEHERRTR